MANDYAIQDNDVVGYLLEPPNSISKTTESANVPLTTFLLQHHHEEHL